jgi:hypothetical protein
MSRSNLRLVVRLVLLLTLVFALSLTEVWADTIGSSLSTSRNNLDVAQGQVYIYAGGDFAGAGETVSTFSWYGPVFSGPRYLTPLLFQDNLNGTYTLEGIGVSFILSGTGGVEGPIAFGLHSGSATTGSNWTFGFVNGIVQDGSVTTASAGVVGFDALEGGAGASGGSSNNNWVYTPTVSGITTLTVGSTTFGANGTFALNSSVDAADRTYSAQANANASGVAEPGTFSLITGAGLVFAGLFRYQYTRGRRS